MENCGAGLAVGRFGVMDDHGLDFDGGREEREGLGFPFQAIFGF